MHQCITSAARIHKILTDTHKPDSFMSENAKQAKDVMIQTDSVMDHTNNNQTGTLEPDPKHLE